MDKQIEGVPEGYRLICFREPKIGDYILDTQGEAFLMTHNSCMIFPILEKIKKRYLVVEPFELPEGFNYTYDYMSASVWNKDGSGGVINAKVRIEER